MIKFGQDPLMEQKYTRLKGLVYKYRSRVLVELNNICADYCAFCTRKRETFGENKWELSEIDLEKIFEFLDDHREIREIIISGGDPLMSPALLVNILDKLKDKDQIKIIRIHTRVPVVAPKKIDKKLLDYFGNFEKVIYMSIHCNLVEELTDEVVLVLKKIQKTGVILYSQSVSLRGINDSVEKLQKLFERLLEIGVRPYYLYRCDKVEGLEKFIVPLVDEKKIMTELRKRISGLACPTYVIDVAGGVGKIPVPLNFWEADESKCFDFNNTPIEICK